MTKKIREELSKIFKTKGMLRYNLVKLKKKS